MEGMEKIFRLDLLPQKLMELIVRVPGYLTQTRNHEMI